jgi:hypothetical protein
MSEYFETTATITIEEYDELLKIRDSEGKILAKRMADFDKYKKEIDARLDKIIWKPQYSISWVDEMGRTFDNLPIEYIGKDEAIKRLTDKIAELTKPGPEIERLPLPLSARVRILFTGIVE